MADHRNRMEEPKRELRLQEDSREIPPAGIFSYPKRLGKPDCPYYLRTGNCGYGIDCIYNHPEHLNQAPGDGTDFPERDGEPECKFFLRTGTCRYRAACKFHHPRDKRPEENTLGLPIRKEEKPCPYYIRTLSCKFGMCCKFHHPEPSSLVSMGSSVAVPDHHLSYSSGPSIWVSREGISSSSHTPALPSFTTANVSHPQGTFPQEYKWSRYLITTNPIGNCNMGLVPEPINLNLMMASFPPKSIVLQCPSYHTYGFFSFEPRFYQPSAGGYYYLPLRVIPESPSFS